MIHCNLCAASPDEGADVIRVSLLRTSRISFYCIRATLAEGYFICYELAKENLALGLTVVADTVNPIEITRNDWRRVARVVGVKSCDVELR